MNKELIYKYDICTCSDTEIYQNQCNVIKKKFPNYFIKTLDDVDGTEICILVEGDNKIKVCNDMNIGAVYVESTFDLLPYFAK